MLSWKELAELFADSNTKAELEFAIIELLKLKGISEEVFWNEVESNKEWSKE